MSFLIAVHVNEGIVLASDRRTTYTNTQTCGDTIIQRIGIHTTNSTDKHFPVLMELVYQLVAMHLC